MPDPEINTTPVPLKAELSQYELHELSLAVHFIHAHHVDSFAPRDLMAMRTAIHKLDIAMANAFARSTT